MSINSKNTKAEILAAYKELEKQKKSLELQIRQQGQKSAAVSASVATPTAKNSSSKAAPNFKQNYNGDLADTIQSLEKIQGGFGGAVSSLSEQLIFEATALEEVKTEIATQTQELENLHQLTDIDDSTIDFLLEQYQTSIKQFSEEYDRQEAQDKREIKDLKQKWLKEQQTHHQAIAARNEADRKNQQREEEEYQYKLDLARDLDESEYTQKRKVRQEELVETLQQIEQQWQQKEAEIAEQEQEYAAAAAKVKAFESQLNSKIKQGTEEGKGIAIYQAKTKADLRDREIEGEKQNYQLQIESLEQTIKHQATRISKLSQQLDSSLQQVQDLAVKAIEGTANRNSFEAVKAIAMEQAKTPQKGK